jgi:hypothetical protein
MRFQYHDGGRAAAGFKGNAGDCAVRAVSIAAFKPYAEVYKALAELHKHKTGKRTARAGIYADDLKRYMKSIGWRWVSTMGIGTGCTMHLDELPVGRVVARVSKHYIAVIYGTVFDTHDSSRGGRRCVYGYWIQNQ